MLRAEELAAMRRTLALSLPDLATRQTKALAPDGFGGQTESWTSTPNVPCRLLSTTTAAPGSQGGQWAVVTSWVLLVRHDQAMRAGDRVLFDGDTYEVVAVRDSQSDRTCRRCDVRRVD